MNVRLAVAEAIQLHADGKLVEAVESYQAILKRHPEACACWSNLGVALRKLGRKGEGLRALREGARICPRLVNLAYNLGNALAEAGEHEEALKCYRTALSRDSGHLEAAHACGAMLLKLERWEQAVHHHRAALERHPDDAQAVSRARLRAPRSCGTCPPPWPPTGAPSPWGRRRPSTGPICTTRWRRSASYAEDEQTVASCRGAGSTVRPPCSRRWDRT